MPVSRVDTIPTLSKRPKESHKGQYGTVLVVAGSRGMAGAAALVGAACLRSGAGLVRVICPIEIQPTVASFEPSYMTHPVANDDEGILNFEAACRAIERFATDSHVLAVGPGLGQSKGVSDLILWVLANVKIPVVLDADGLNALAGFPDAVRTRSAPLIITPHPGEFGRLTGKDTASVESDRETLAVEFAGRSDHLTVVLKGSGTIVTDGSRVYINNTGNPGMATGGTGDVLTGVIAALIGQKLPPFEAAQLGTYVHGLAGDIARDQNGEVGMIAGDLIDSLPDAFFHLPN